MGVFLFSGAPVPEDPLPGLIPASAFHYVKENSPRLCKLRMAVALLSPVAQWLRIHLPTQRMPVQSLVRGYEDPICARAANYVCRNEW